MRDFNWENWNKRVIPVFLIEIPIRYLGIVKLLPIYLHKKSRKIKITVIIIYLNDNRFLHLAIRSTEKEWHAKEKAISWNLVSKSNIATP